MLLPYMAEGIKFADGIKVVNQLSFKYKIILDYPRSLKGGQGLPGQSRIKTPLALLGGMDTWSGNWNLHALWWPKKVEDRCRRGQSSSSLD